MDEETLAITAAYFELGLKAKIFDEDDARSWALSIVEASDTPPLDAIEVLASRSLTHLLETLSNAHSEKDAQVAGRWLFHTLRLRALANRDVASAVAHQAYQVAQSAGLPQRVCFEFCAIDDGFYLADSGAFGTFDLCFVELTKALAQAEIRPDPCLLEAPAKPA